MKDKYFAFCGMEYCSKGGMDDFIGRFESLQQAGLAIGDYIKNENNINNLSELIDMYWYHIFDIEKMIVVFDEGSDIDLKLELG